MLEAACSTLEIADDFLFVEFNEQRHPPLRVLRRRGGSVVAPQEQKESSAPRARTTDRSGALESPNLLAAAVDGGNVRRSEHIQHLRLRSLPHPQMQLHIAVRQRVPLFLRRSLS